MDQRKTEEKKPESGVETIEQKPVEPVTLEKINELLTNNLKWSQIIYEQTRKINRKMFWSALFDYIKLGAIIVVLLVGFVYLIPGVNNVLKTIDVFSGVDICKEGTLQKGAFLDAFLKQFPLEQAAKEQLKALLK